MRNFFTAFILILFLATTSFADVRWIIVGQEFTADGHIKIDTEYYNDNNTPLDTSDDIQIGATDHRLWNPVDFIGLTNAEKGAVVGSDIKKKGYGNLLFSYLTNSGAEINIHKAWEYLKRQNVETIFNKFPNVVGQTGSVSSISVLIDSQGDGICDKDCTIYPDGSNSCTAVVSPVACK